MNSKQTRILVATDAEELPVTLEALIGAHRAVMERLRFDVINRKWLNDDALTDADSALKGDN